MKRDGTLGIFGALAMGLFMTFSCATDDAENVDSETEQDTDTGVVPGEACERLLGTTGEQSTVGCVFYPVDLVNAETANPEFAIVAANNSRTETATATLYTPSNAGWEVFRTKTIEPNDLVTFLPPDVRHLETPGLQRKEAFKLVSTDPITAYQLNSFTATYTSDGSTLIPVSSMGTHHHIVGAEHVEVNDNYLFPAYFAVVATQDDTKVTVTPSVVPQPVSGVLPTTEPFDLVMDDGDVLYVSTRVRGDNLTGSTVQSDHPIGVFSGHQCITIPEHVMACDHLEDQLPSVDFWGYEFVAPHFPSRKGSNPVDSVKWQIYAAEDDTTVQIDAPAGVEVPFTSKVFAKGESVEFFTESSGDDPGDFYVRSVPIEEPGQDPVNKPIAVVQYMTSSAYYGDDDAPGDPSMVYVSPVRQFLPRYTILVPEGWDDDAVLITRPNGQEITIDEVPIPDSAFNDVPGANFQVARYVVEDGVHRVSSTSGKNFGIIVTGWRSDDSYAYVGGMGLEPPAPQ